MSKNYDTSFACSMEQLYSPIVCFDQAAVSGISGIWKRTPASGLPPTTLNPTGDFPCFELRDVDYHSYGGRGFKFGSGLSPSSFDLDPYFGRGDNDFVHVIKDVRESTKDMNIIKDPIKYCAKTVGLRGPLLLSGWGFDIAGFPVPASGTNKWGFNENAAVDRKLWKTGPVDLRWHGGRKVWVGGNEILEGILMTNLSANGASTDEDGPFKSGINHGGGQMKVYRKSATGQFETKGELVTLTNLDSSLSAPVGTYVMAVEVNYQWRPIWVGC
jgi:hypothetical protein